MSYFVILTFKNIHPSGKFKGRTFFKKRLYLNGNENCNVNVPIDRTRYLLKKKTAGKKLHPHMSFFSLTCPAFLCISVQEKNVFP